MAEYGDENSSAAFAAKWGLDSLEEETPRCTLINQILKMKGHCPICGGEAKNATPGNFDGLIIKCKHCGDYGITDSALNDFLRLDLTRVSPHS